MTRCQVWRGIGLNRLCPCYSPHRHPLPRTVLSHGQRSEIEDWEASFEAAHASEKYHGKLTSWWKKALKTNQVMRRRNQE